MTPAQLRTLLDRAGLAQRAAARVLGLDERTMRRYASGEYPVPVVVEYAIRWVAAQAA